jgi:hypothetical protein
VGARKLVPLPLRPVPDMLYGVIDGTGVPMTARETAGREGKGEDGRARTREVKLAVFFNQPELSDEGYPVRDRASSSYIASFETASVFAGLVKAEGIRRGADHVRQLTFIGDGAAWIWNLVTGKFPAATQAGDGQDSTSFAALATLRDRYLPATLGKAPGISYAVAGDTASSHDNIQTVRGNTPLVLAVVAVLAFAVLLAGFRSVPIPVVSIVLNLLSVAAAYGLITLIFQDGRLQGLLGYTSFGAITWWVPLFMFVLLFGISMDYHVFILSRIREHWTRGVPTREAIAEGIASSAGVVTSAALIMVAVFSIFLTLPLIELKILGIGMGAAVLIDATVVRGVLLPATLSLLGDRAWRLRSRADRST